MTVFAANTAYGATVESNSELGAGLAAQLGCGSVFVTGRDPAEVERDDLEPGRFTKGAHLEVDRQHNRVTARIAGAVPREALYRPEVGCTLLSGKVDPAILRGQVSGITPMKNRSGAAWPLGDAPNGKPLPTVDHRAIDAAVQGVFDAMNQDGRPDTRAVIVVYKGQIVAEQYAPGFGRSSKLLAWSASKSIMGAIIGTLVDDRRLSLDAPVPFWPKDDARAAITTRNLLNMASGLAFSERYGPDSDVTKMLFVESNMAGYTARTTLGSKPGSHWSYSSGDANLLGALAFRVSGGSLRDFTAYARKRLLEPTGMTSVVLEPDETGAPVGSSYFYATARDWARFGLMHLNMGKVGGRQVLSEQWVRFVQTSSAEAGSPRYGADFWLVRPDERTPGAPGLPLDAYLAKGYNQQIIAIIPSRDTVIVRLGWTPEAKRFDYNLLLGRILDALPSPQAVAAAEKAQLNHLQALPTRSPAGRRPTLGSAPEADRPMVRRMAELTRARFGDGRIRLGGGLRAWGDCRSNGFGVHPRGECP